MSTTQRKRRGGTVNSRQARKRSRLMASTAEMASEAEPIELEESVSRPFTGEEGKHDFRKYLAASLNNKPPENWFDLLLSYKNLPLVIDELHRKGPQELLKHLHVYSDEMGVTAAATMQTGKLNLGAHKFEGDKEYFIINCAKSLKGTCTAQYYYILSGEEVVDLTCESSDPVVVDLTHNDSVVIVEENQRQRRNLRLRSQRQSDSCVLSSDDEDETRDNDVYVADKAAQELGQLEEETASSKPSGTVSCPICMDVYSEIVQSGRLIVSTKCGHVFCSQCLRDSLRNANSCPTCRKKLTHRQYHPIYI